MTTAQILIVVVIIEPVHRANLCIFIEFISHLAGANMSKPTKTSSSKSAGKSPAVKGAGSKQKSSHLSRQAKPGKQVLTVEEELMAKECITPEDVMALQGATEGGCGIEIEAQIFLSLPPPYGHTRVSMST